MHYIAKSSRVWGLLRSADTEFVWFVDVVLRVILGRNTLYFGSLPAESINIGGGTMENEGTYT